MEHGILARLPLELRQQVYAHLFSGTHCNIQIYKGLNYVVRAFPEHLDTKLQSRTTSQRKQQRYDDRLPLSLLLTSRAINDEVREALYSLSTFHVHLFMRHLPIKAAAAAVSAARGMVLSSVPPCDDADVTLDVPSKISKFLRHARFLDLDVWLPSARMSAAELRASMHAFLAIVNMPSGSRSLPANDGSVVTLRARLRRRPAWMEDEETGMGDLARVLSDEPEERSGEADELLLCLAGTRPLKRKQLLIDADVTPLISHAVLARWQDGEL